MAWKCLQRPCTGSISVVTSPLSLLLEGAIFIVLYQFHSANENDNLDLQNGIPLPRMKPDLPNDASLSAIAALLSTCMSLCILLARSPSPCKSYMPTGLSWGNPLSTSGSSARHPFPPHPLTASGSFPKVSRYCLWQIPSMCSDVDTGAQICEPFFLIRSRADCLLSQAALSYTPQAPTW